MKREILCPECGRNTRDLFPSDNPYSGEYINFVVGNARDHFSCDHCNRNLKPMAACVAFMVYTAMDQFYPWWNDYIMPVDSVDMRLGL